MAVLDTYWRHTFVLIRSLPINMGVVGKLQVSISALSVACYAKTYQNAIVSRVSMKSIVSFSKIMRADS